MGILTVHYTVKKAEAKIEKDSHMKNEEYLLFLARLVVKYSPARIVIQNISAQKIEITIEPDKS